MSTTAINIDKLLGKVRNRVHRVGVELEGGWKTLPRGTRIDPDTSVKFPEYIDQFTGIYRADGPQYVGEIPSPILVPFGGASDTEISLEKWLRQHYPPFHNASCGMHTHMSFRNLFHYQRLMDERFQLTIVEYVRRWALRQVEDKFISAKHPIFDRLDGKSEYCQLKFHADDQVAKTRKEYDHFGHGHRYTAINYSWRTNTVEARILSMMPSVDIALSLIKETLNITSAYLVATATREKPAVSYWVGEPDQPETVYRFVEV